MREGLCYDIALKPYSGRRKVAIIDDADYLNKEGANCLLKTLEEPPPKSLLILIGTSEQRQLPTIRSRCQIVRFQPLPEQDVAELLLATGACEDAERWPGGRRRRARGPSRGRPCGATSRSSSSAGNCWRCFRRASPSCWRPPN